MWVRPTDDPSRALVRDPRTKRRMPPEGKEVVDHDLLWHRALRRGDVQLGKAPMKAAQPEPTDAAVETHGDSAASSS